MKKLTLLLTMVVSMAFVSTAHAASAEYKRMCNVVGTMSTQAFAARQKGYPRTEIYDALTSRLSYDDTAARSIVSTVVTLVYSVDKYEDPAVVRAIAFDACMSTAQ